jgi:hypothetical protein
VGGGAGGWGITGAVVGRVVGTGRTVGGTVGEASNSCGVIVGEALGVSAASVGSSVAVDVEGGGYGCPGFAPPAGPPLLCVGRTGAKVGTPGSDAFGVLVGNLVVGGG